MKKKIVIPLIVIIILVIAFPYIFVECNTAFYGTQFENEYQQTKIISNIEYYKVFYYMGNKAKVYYVEENHLTAYQLRFF